MKWIISLVLIFVFSCSYGQQQAISTYKTQDSLINQLMKSEDYGQAAEMMEQQFLLIEQNSWDDSLYHYCYNYGRAVWRDKDAETGLVAAETISKKIKENDADILHYLQTLNDLSWLYYETGNVDRCFENDSIYLNICLTSENISADLISMAYYNLAYDYMEFGKYQEALEQFILSADVILNSSDSLQDRLSMSYNAIGAMQWRVGHFEEAMKSYQSSLDLISSSTDPKLMLEKGNILGNIALILQDNGEIIKALEYHEKFVKIDLEALPHIEDAYLKETAYRRISSAYINMADIYFRMGDYGKSRKLINLAIDERKRILEPDDPSLASTMESLATLELNIGNFQEAEDNYRYYLAYCEEYFGEQSGNTARAYLGLAMLFRETKDFTQSNSYFKKAISTQQKVGKPASDPALANMYRERAVLFMKSKNYAKAKADFEQSRQIYLNSRNEDNPVIIELQQQMAELSLDAGDFHEAAKLIDNILLKLNISRPVVIDQSQKNWMIRYPYLLPNLFYLKAKALLAQDKEGNMLEAFEHLDVAIDLLKSVKQGFVDEESKLLFYEAHQKIFNLAIDLVFELYNKTTEKQWIETFFNLSEENRTILLRSKLLNFSALDFAGVPDSILSKERMLVTQLKNESNDPEITQDIVDLERQYESLIDIIKKDYPEYYSLKFEDTKFSLNDVKHILTDTSNTLLLYSLSNDYLYTLIVSDSREELFRSERGTLTDDVLKINNAIIAKDDNLINDLSTRLYEKLIKQLRPLIKGEELFIIPDGDLFFLNFEILKAKSAKGKIHSGMLIHDYVISYYLSATVAMQFKNLEKQKGEGLLTFAPGFSDRHKQHYRESVLDSSVMDEKFFQYIRQPFTVESAKQIGGLFSGDVFVEDEADETTFKNEAVKYGIIHLGTHAEIDQNMPMMSHLVLSKNIGQTSLDDGYLHAYEIYQMPLRAELAVLTACETGIGKQQNSEGVISLAHSFSYAGCPSIVMSLWNIDEKTSAGIINDFYHYLSEGYTKNHALRLAKLNYLDQTSLELQSPYYWAGLVLLGDNNQVNISTTFDWRKWTPIFAVVLILLLVVIRRKK